jgi:hypothetical protein
VSRISNRERDRLFAQVHARLEGAEALITELAKTWWGRLALKLALRNVGRG